VRPSRAFISLFRWGVFPLSCSWILLWLARKHAHASPYGSSKVFRIHLIVYACVCVPTCTRLCARMHTQRLTQIYAHTPVAYRHRALEFISPSPWMKICNWPPLSISWQTLPRTVSLARILETGLTLSSHPPSLSVSLSHSLTLLLQILCPTTLCPSLTHFHSHSLHIHSLVLLCLSFPCL